MDEDLKDFANNGGFLMQRIRDCEENITALERHRANLNDNCGSWLREQRKKHKLSLRAFGKLSGSSAPNILDLENGNRCWNEKKILKFIEVFSNLK